MSTTAAKINTESHPSMRLAAFVLNNALFGGACGSQNRWKTNVHKDQHMQVTSKYVTNITTSPQPDTQNYYM